MIKKQNFKLCFSASYETEKIWQLWNQYHKLLELALKLGLAKDSTLTRNDYEYIETIKNRNN